MPKHKTIITTCRLGTISNIKLLEAEGGGGLKPVSQDPNRQFE